MKTTKKKTAKRTIKPKEFSLVGRFFHQYKADGVIGWQGQVLGAPGPSTYLVQLKSWIDGGDTDQVLVTLDEMKGWKFYDSADAMRDAYESYCAQRKHAERAAGKA